MNHHPAFTWQRNESIPSLNLEMALYEHKATGARHIHLNTQDRNNVFLVAFKTVPQDSTGVAHILEHTALCGSQAYPVRDPFFMMTRRSLNTFMNAFTASDWTAYPFASQNPKDFDNLLRIYLDAAFFPNLEELDFRQEGHRLEFATADDPTTDLVFKGVVFNEMKGAMSSPSSILWQRFTEHLFPTITYHHNSGGEPECIPDLTYTDLKAFHAKHYHPSNALFITYGDIPAASHQERFETLALSRFERQALNFSVPDEQRFDTPKAVSLTYPLSVEEAEDEPKTHVIVGWLLGKNNDMETVLSLQLLTDILLGNSASPLRHALETSSLGKAPSPLCGFEESTREMVLICGLEGANPEAAEAIEQEILQVLTDLATHGVEYSLAEAMLHQLEFSQREVGGDHTPYGLQLMLNLLAPTLHGADPAATLAIDSLLARLRDKIQNPRFIPDLIQHWLLDNQHRLRLVLTPDTTLSEQMAATEKARLAQLKAAMSEAEKQHIVDWAAALKARQEAQDNVELLPKVDLTDVEPQLYIPLPRYERVNDLSCAHYSQGTNGLVYAQIVIDLPPLAEELLALLPTFSSLLTEVGCGQRDYLAMQAWQAAVSGGISASVSVRASVHDLNQSRGLFTLAGKALVRNQAALAELLATTLEQARFDESSRLREIMAQARASSERSITGSGHSLAMLAASSHSSPVAALAHQWRGLAAIRRIKAMDQAIQSDDGLQTFVTQLQALHHKLLQAPRQLLLISEESQRLEFQQHIANHWRQASHPVPATLELPILSPTPTLVQQAWITSTQVNFCASSYPTVAINHPDAAALIVLGGFLRNGYLHRAIREQGGAYGGGASYDSDSGCFRFYSYRDPRLLATLQDFEGALPWLLNHQNHSVRTVEEAILGVISDMDRPGSPAGEASRAFFNALHGRTPQQREQLRQAILAITLEDLQRVGADYLKPQHASIAVITQNPDLPPELQSLERCILSAPTQTE